MQNLLSKTNIFSSEAKIFNDKYCNNLYTKSDLKNPKIWNTETFKADAAFLKRWQNQTIEIIIICVNVIQESYQEMTIQIQIQKNNNSRLIFDYDIDIQISNQEKNITYNFKQSDDPMDKSLTIIPNSGANFKLHDYNNLGWFFGINPPNDIY